MAANTHQHKRAPHGQAWLLMVLIGALMILLAVGAALFTNTGQGRQSENGASQSHSKPAPLDLFP